MTPKALSYFGSNVLVRKYKHFGQTLSMPTIITVCTERLYAIRNESMPFHNSFIDDSSETYLGMKIEIDNSLKFDEFKLA